MKYWQEGSTSTVIHLTSTSDAANQHRQIGGATFGTAHVCTDNSVKILSKFDVFP